jgi:hypothetical protein
MKVRIRKLATNPMQSGQRDNCWNLSVIEQKDDRYVDDIKGLTSCDDTKLQLELKFKSKEDAVKYATDQKWQYEICEANKATIKKKSYASNFVAPILG